MINFLLSLKSEHACFLTDHNNFAVVGIWQYVASCMVSCKLSTYKQKQPGHDVSRKYMYTLAGGCNPSLLKYPGVDSTIQTASTAVTMDPSIFGHYRHRHHAVYLGGCLNTG